MDLTALISSTTLHGNNLQQRVRTDTERPAGGHLVLLRAQSKAPIHGTGTFWVEPVLAGRFS